MGHYSQAFPNGAERRDRLPVRSYVHDLVLIRTSSVYIYKRSSFDIGNSSLIDIANSKSIYLSIYLILHVSIISWLYLFCVSRYLYAPIHFYLVYLYT